MMKRGSAVLEAPEARYGSGVSGPRRVADSLRREFSEDPGRRSDDSHDSRDPQNLRDVHGEDEDEDEFGSDARLAGEDPAARRGGLRTPAPSGFLARLAGGVPRTIWGRVAAAVVLLVGLGLCAAGAWEVREMLVHDARFVIPSSAAIAIEGNQHVTKAQLLSVFGGDVDRNIFTVSLAERRMQLERLPWVQHATVMRLLPDHLRVLIAERTPVAFVRQGGHIGLVDKSGVMMDMALSAGGSAGGEEDVRYSFPVVTGLAGTDPLSTRAARMKIFARFTSELDAGGSKVSEGLSEVDLSDPEDVRALIPEEHAEVLVHFGDTDFLDRYQKYKAHLAEWRTQYPRLAAVDMRYDRQVVLEMQPGSAIPVTEGQAVSPVGAVPTATSAPTNKRRLAASGTRKADGGGSSAAAVKPKAAAATVAKAKVAPSTGVAAPGQTTAPPQGAGRVAPHLTIARDVRTTKKMINNRPVEKKAAGVAAKHPWRAAVKR